MIVLYRTQDDARGAEVQAALERLVVAHRVELVDGATSAAPVRALPAIVEGERTISGDDDLDAYLDELAAWMHEWRKYQSDSCYVSC